MPVNTSSMDHKPDHPKQYFHTSNNLNMKIV